MSTVEARIAVLGLGYVGCVTAACLAKLGHRVTGVDRDEFKVGAVLSGKAPFYEPGLEPIIAEAVAAHRLSATPDLAAALQDADVALVCVGTPSEANGNLGLGQLRRVSEEIAALMQGRSRRLIIAVRSTVFPGTCEQVVATAVAGHPAVRIVSNPEFLREGTAVRDFLEPSLLVVGGGDPESVAFVADLYRDLPIQPCRVTLRTAEMIKYACNCFHALKIGFANEIGTLCTRLDIPALEVMQTLCQDVKLNISPAYLTPGFAFGGSCLPKDLRALTYRAGRMDLKLPLLENVLPSNDQHLQRAIRSVLDVPAERIGIFGLAFKENTDDLRESPVVALIEHLLGKGRELRVFDPHIKLEEIYGANRQFVLNALPHIGKLLVPSLADVTGWCDHIVIAQKPSAAFDEQLQASGKPTLDLVRL